LVGANSLQRTVQVTSAFITALNGLVIIFVVSSDIWARRRARRRAMVPEAPVGPDPPVGRDLIVEGEVS
jgi:simple sugar transport system permease protein